jgi:ABC-type branched-subunit amino acid transport system ATPase component
MIESVQFRNFKVLRDTTLPLSRFTLLVGPNSSGKSTALQALQAAANLKRFSFDGVATAGLPPKETVEVVLQWGGSYEGAATVLRATSSRTSQEQRPSSLPQDVQQLLAEKLQRAKIYALDANAIAASRNLQPNAKLQSNGADLVIVLDRLRDRAPERFEALNAELGRRLPEFDRILFDTPSEGTRAFLLRTREGHHPIPAADLRRAPCWRWRSSRWLTCPTLRLSWALRNPTGVSIRGCCAKYVTPCTVCAIRKISANRAIPRRLWRRRTHRIFSTCAGIIPKKSSSPRKSGKKRVSSACPIVPISTRSWARRPWAKCGIVVFWVVYWPSHESRRLQRIAC